MLHTGACANASLLTYFFISIISIFIILYFWGSNKILLGLIAMSLFRRAILSGYGGLYWIVEGGQYWALWMFVEGNIGRL